MAARPKHKPRRRNCASRWRRLIVEQFEPRMLLSSAPSGTDKTVTTLEDTAYVVSTTDFGFTDVGDTPPNVFLAVKVTTLPTRGVLSVNGAAIGAGNFVSVVDIGLGRLAFRPVANANGPAYSTLTFQVQDTGSLANGGVDLDPTPRTLTFNVTPVNDPPTGLAGETNKSIQMLKSASIFNSTHVFTRTDFGFTDPQDMPSPNNLYSVIVTAGLSPPLGTLTYNGVPVTAPVVVLAADIDAGKMIYTAPLSPGVTAFSFKVQDDGGTADGGVDTDPTARTMNMLVGQPVFQAPSGSNGTVNSIEDVPYAFQVADFGFIDPDNNNFYAVKTIALPVAGLLTDNGTAVATNQFITVGDILLGKLRYLPPANANGPAVASFVFQVQDDGDVSSGGQNLDSLARTMTINVTSVNDAPIGMSSTIAMLACPTATSHVFTRSDFGFTDPNDSPANNLAAVVIVTPPSVAGLTFNGAPVVAGQIVTTSDINAGKLVFTTTVSRTPQDASFTFQVKDDGGTANGGVDIDPVPKTLTIHGVIAPSHPPSGNSAVSTLEDVPYTFRSADFPVSADVTLLAVKITTLPIVGTLADNGVPVTVGLIIPVADIAAGRVAYTPPANAYGANLSLFQYQEQDDGGTCGSPNDFGFVPSTVTINVMPVNDPPVGISYGPFFYPSLPEDNLYTFRRADFGFTDPADNPANNFLGVRITSLPTAGMLQLFGNLGPQPVFVGDFITAAELDAGLLVFAPAPNANGAPYGWFLFRVKDDGGTANGGIDTDTVDRRFALNVLPVNDAPIGTDTTVTTLEDASYTLQLADFGFADVADQPANAFMGVRITALPLAGTLTLNGSAVAAGDIVPVAFVAGGQLQFAPAANANGAAYASFLFQVQDNGGTANGGINLDPTPNTLTFNVTAVNDPPLGADAVRTILESHNYTVSFADFNFRDSNDIPANSMSGVYITTLPALGALTVGGAPVTPGQFISAFQMSSGTLVFAAPSQAATPTTSLTFQVRDNGGTFNGGIDTDPVPKTLTLYMARAEQRISGQDHTVTGYEDTPYTFSAADFPFTDTFDPPFNQLAEITVFAIPFTGSLSYRGSTVQPGQTVSSQDLVQGALRYVPASNGAGQPYASFRFYLKDLGNNFTAISNTQTINLLAANDPPFGSDSTVTTSEDTTYAFTASYFGYSDPIDNGANALAAVIITSLPASGALKIGSTVLTTSNLLTVGNIPAGNISQLTFTPSANTNDVNHIRPAFTFRVKDNGGTFNGGIDTSLTPNTLTISVTSVNDAPTGMNQTVTTLEDTSYTLRVTDFGFSDPNDNPPDFLMGVRITTLPLAGALTRSGSAVVAGELVSVDLIAAGQLQFVPAANANGAAYASFTFQVQDNGGIANGGMDLDPTPNTLTINVTSINDAPTGANKSLVVPACAQTPYVFSPSDFGYSDPNDTPANNLAFVKTTFSGSGVLTNNGVQVPADTLIPLADLAAGNVRYTPPANPSGAILATITFQVQDNGGTANGGIDRDPTQHVISIYLSPGPNLAPSAIDGTITTYEDVPYVFHVSDFPFSDLEGNNLKSVIITSLPAQGKLINNGVDLVSAGQVIPAIDITSGRFKFLPLPVNAFAPNFFAQVSYKVQDDGGTACGGADTDSIPNTITIAVNPVNDPPIGTDRTLAMMEDVSYVFSPADFAFSDPLDSPANSLAGVIIATIPERGVLVDDNVLVLPGQFIPAIHIATGTLRYIPQTNVSGNAIANFTFFVKDNGGTANGGLDVALNRNTITFNVFGCFGHPVINRDKTINSLEDNAYTFGYADFGLSDPFDSPPPGERLKIVSLPPAGILADNGVAVVPGQYVSVSDITAGRLIFVPAANANGAPYTSFVFQVESDDTIFNACGDDGTGTITLNIASVNDPPSGADRVLVASPSTGYTFSVTDFPITDNNDSPPNTLIAIAITALPTTGTLALNGIHVDAGQLVPVFSLIAGQLRFTPLLQVDCAPAGSFEFQVKDSGGTANGGADLDPVPNTITFYGALGPPATHAPAGLDGVINELQDSPYVFQVGDFSFFDADVPPNSLRAVIVSSLPSVGALFNSGVPVAVDQYILAADILAGHFTFERNAPSHFQPTENPLTSFTFQVQDDGGAGGCTDLDPSPNSLTINVLLVNEAPSFLAGADQNVTDESGPQAIDAWATGISAGPPDEQATQQVHFVVASNSNAALFAVLPAIDPAGRLTFTPSPNVSDSAQISFFLADDGGTANGGIDQSQPQTLTIHITKLRPWHNAALALDVTGDGHIVGGDALAIINFINAFGSQPVPKDGDAEGPYYDVTGDGAVAPGDALEIINYVNAFPNGEGEAADIDDLMALLAVDVASQPRRRR